MMKEKLSCEKLKFLARFSQFQFALIYFCNLAFKKLLKRKTKIALKQLSSYNSTHSQIFCLLSFATLNSVLTVQQKWSKIVHTEKNCYLLWLLPTMFSLESFLSLSCPTCSFSFVWTFPPSHHLHSDSKVLLSFHFSPPASLLSRRKKVRKKLLKLNKKYI